MNYKRMVWLQGNFTIDIFFSNFRDYGKFLWMMVFKVFSICKAIFRVDLKTQISLELLIFWCLYYNIWTRFYLLLCIWRIRSSHPGDFSKKFQKFIGKHKLCNNSKWLKVVNFCCKTLCLWSPAWLFQTIGFSGKHVKYILAIFSLSWMH